MSLIKAIVDNKIIVFDPWEGGSPGISWCRRPFDSYRNPTGGLLRIIRDPDDDLRCPRFWGTPELNKLQICYEKHQLVSKCPYFVCAGDAKNHVDDFLIYHVSRYLKLMTFV